LDRAERLAEAAGDLRLREAFEEGQLDHAPLSLGQAVERRADDLPRLGCHAGILARRLVRSGYRLIRRRHKGLFSSTYGTQLVDCPGFRAHDHPGLGTAPPGVVAGSVLPDLAEDLLQHLLRGSRITQDPAYQPEGGRGEGVVEAAESLAVTLGDPGEERDGRVRRGTGGLHMGVMTTSPPARGQYIRPSVLARRAR